MSTSSKELEKRLLEAGKALLLLPSSVDTLLHLLDVSSFCYILSKETNFYTLSGQRRQL